MKNRIKLSREVYVIWPSERVVAARNVGGFDSVLRLRRAVGYVGSSGRVSGCKYIVITTGPDRFPREHYLAEILSVESNQRLLDRAEKGNFPAVDVSFSEPVKIVSEAVSRILDNLVWSSRNVRYLNEEDLVPSAEDIY